MPEAPKPDRARHPLVEVLGVYAMVCAGTFAITRLGRLPLLEDLVHLGVGALFLLTALWRIGRERAALEHHGVALGGLLAPADDTDHEPAGPFGIYDLFRIGRRSWRSALRETGAALAIAAVVFPPFLFAFGWYHRAQGWPAVSLRGGFASFALAQVVVVALPEEVFFRGYVQTRLSDFFGPPPRAWMQVHPSALLLQSVLFAIVHFVAIPNPARLAVFFPGLLFGMVRGWRGGVGAAIVLHALSNVYSDLLVRGWLY